jgi:hypothetical protein
MAASAVASRGGLLRKDLGGKANPTEPDKPAGPSKALTPNIRPSKSGQIANPPKRTTS